MTANVLRAFTRTVRRDKCIWQAHPGRRNLSSGLTRADEQPTVSYYTAFVVRTSQGLRIDDSESARNESRDQASPNLSTDFSSASMRITMPFVLAPNGHGAPRCASSRLRHSKPECMQSPPAHALAAISVSRRSTTRFQTAWIC